LSHLLIADENFKVILIDFSSCLSFFIVIVIFLSIFVINSLISKIIHLPHLLLCVFQKDAVCIERPIHPFPSQEFPPN